MEIHDLATFRAILAGGRSLAGLRLQGLDLTAVADQLMARTDVRGLVVLGGRLDPALHRHLTDAGAVVFPADPHTPVDVYRARLYRAAELYAGIDDGGYAATPDARAYAWSRDARCAHDVYATVLRATHDDCVSDALDEFLIGHRVVGVMGGHALSRAQPEYAAAAHLANRLARDGFLLATGGGPGAMEAVNLGARCPEPAAATDALAVLATVPDYRADVTAWCRSALHIARELPDSGAPRSVGVPTWFYGHEPTNVFADGIAKFFSNALREDGLLARCDHGIVVLPGAAGTMQEIFQTATRLYYGPAGELPPLVLVGRDHWTRTLPVWPALVALARDTAMADALHLVDDAGEVAAVLSRDAAARTASET